MYALATLAAACADGGGTTTIPSVTTSTPPTATSPAPTTASTTTPDDGTAALFIGLEDELDPPPRASRSRLVEVDLDVLLDGNGRPREVGTFRLDLFEDTSYRAVVDEIREEGGAITWLGTLEDVERSYFTIVYTASVLAGHFAGPQGVFEVAFAGSGRYRVTQVDQSQMPTEEA